MHERSLVQNLLRQVEQIVAAEGGGQVAEICVQAGDLSGVEPLLFQMAFADMAPAVFSSSCQLALEVVPVTAVCSQCDHRFEIVDFQFRCPVCQAGSVQVLQGDEVKLISVTINSKHSIEGVAS
ncbi:hydrogenase maturation nickel metallochaperone HypA [uncultured Gimesia sp.]|jgi:hydrogenase nickel incorporation protein HypA/HybF|uniref:hydrogenase maturation nickel metallochaperone HypA/HybF n=1 Tax=uncultured Gimesia sp. TaxID=1678688 RepID=UPI00262AE4E0|nr:hydrogenase maturation nickel metallochaperone HypA [uncultured Gimesia sp.]